MVGGFWLLSKIYWFITLRYLFDYLLPYRHWQLIRQFAKRDVAARYRQSWLGTLWLVLTPLLMLTVYTFVFRSVMRQKWFGLEESNLSFSLRIYAGLAVFNFFAECVSRAPNLIREQPHLVKKVVFPIEVLAWINVFSALVGLCVSMFLLILMSGWSVGGFQLTALALPVVWLPLMPLCVGLGWILSAIGTYVQDIGQLLGAALSALMFLSPIFFPLEALPESARSLMSLNPLALVMSQSREVLLMGQWPDWTLLMWQFFGCTFVAIVGALFFKVARAGFADVV